MAIGDLGKVYQDGEVIVRQGETGNCMYVIQAGQVDVVQSRGEEQVHLATLKAGDFFGEMALFEREVRSATVRAAREARVLTVDKRALFARIAEDPSLALRLLERLSRRIRELSAELVRVKTLDLSGEPPPYHGQAGKAAAQMGGGISPPKAPKNR